jgi:hypothetical protein
MPPHADHHGDLFDNSMHFGDLFLSRESLAVILVAVGDECSITNLLHYATFESSTTIRPTTSLTAQPNFNVCANQIHENAAKEPLSTRAQGRKLCPQTLEK